MKTKKQLKSEINQLKLELHTKKYIHIPIPSWKGFGKLILTLFTAILSYFNFMLMLKILEDYNLGYVFAKQSEIINYSPKFADLIILYPLIGEYILVGLTIIFAVSLFKKLKGYNEKGLVVGLIIGLMWGLVVGPIVGLMWGLVVGPIVGLIIGLLAPIDELIVGLIGGLVFGLANGLIGGLLAGLIIGLGDEFD